jgi:hypothetical protein
MPLGLFPQQNVLEGRECRQQGEDQKGNCHSVDPSMDYVGAQKNRDPASRDRDDQIDPRQGITSRGEFGWKGLVAGPDELDDYGKDGRYKKPTEQYSMDTREKSSQADLHG